MLKSINNSINNYLEDNGKLFFTRKFQLINIVKMMETENTIGQNSKQLFFLARIITLLDEILVLNNIIILACKMDKYVVRNGVFT